jgi:hypothetical protein
LLYGEKASFKCAASGVPKPSVVWYKDDELVENIWSDQMVVDWDGTLQLIDATVDLNGDYRCVAKNLGGMTDVGMNVNVYCKMFSTMLLTLLVLYYID